MNVDTRPDHPGHKTAARVSLLPLGLIVLSAFLPTVRSCERIEVPVEYFAANPGGLAAFGLPYIMALLLGVMIVVALVRGFAPRRNGIVWASVGIGLCGLESIALVGSGLVNMFKDRSVLALTFVGSGLLVAGVVGFVHGVRTVGWRAVTSLLLAFGCFALASPVGAFIAAATADDLFGHHRQQQSGAGAWIFFAAALSLAVVGAWGSWSEPKPAEPQSGPRTIFR